MQPCGTRATDVEIKFLDTKAVIQIFIIQIRLNSSLFVFSTNTKKLVFAGKSANA